MKINNEISLEVQNKTNEILMKYNKNELLWICECYFNKIYTTRDISHNPCIYYYQQGLTRKTPPYSYSHIILMHVEMDNEREKKEYNKYIFEKVVEYLKL